MRDINSLNRVILIGNLGDNPVMRRLPQQERWVARFSIATKEKLYRPNSAEQPEPRTEWHDIVVWGNQAEFCQKYLAKGKQVLVEGKLRTRKWQDKEGNKRKTTEVEAVNIILLGRREDSAASSDTTDLDAAPYARSSAAAAGGPDFPDEEPGGGPAGGDDDVPF